VRAPRRGFAAFVVRAGRRVWRTAARLPGLMGRAAWHGFVCFYRSDDLTFASSIAFYALLSLFPFLLLSFSLLGYLSANEHDRGAILGFVLQYFPRQFDFVTLQLEAFRQRTTALNLGGSVVMVWAALGFFGAITTAVNYAWRVQPFGYWKHKLVSFLMLCAAGLLMVVGLGMLSARTLLRASLFASVPYHFPALNLFGSLLVEWLTSLIFIVVVGLLFYFVPNARVRFRDVWPGALVTGVLWRLALMGFGWYVRDLSRFSVHGSVAAVVVFLIWVYMSAVILIYGVEFTVAYARLRRGLPDAARPVDSIEAPQEEPGGELAPRGEGTSTAG
jgi:membrane protein